MPIIRSDGCTLNVEVSGPEGAPVLMLSNSLGATMHMWDDQAVPFAEHFRLVRYDRRGHGGSSVPTGPYTMEMLARDALAIMDALALDRVNWCGLSMGGMEGMWLAANAPHRFHRVILSNTGAYYADKQTWNDRMKTVTGKGTGAIADGTMQRWFTSGFREREPQAVARLRAMVEATPREGYVGCCAAVRDMDHRDLLPTIKTPTLVIAGRHDQATTPADAAYLQGCIPGARMTVIDAAHISNVEQPRAYTDAVLDFLCG